MNRTRTIVLGGILLVVAMLGAWSVFAYVQQAKPAAPELPVVATSTSPVATSSPETPVVSNPGTPAPSVRPYGSVTLSLGKTARFAGLTITPLSIVEDSRCPLGVMCIQAGTVRVSVRVASAMGTNTETLTWNRPFTTEAETITLTEIQPVKRHTPTASAEYRLVFKVEKRDVTARCYVGGCSSEVCSDQPSAVSNCIYRPEFACYRAATCERQASGSCGWTETPALKACLANPPQ